MSTNQPNIFELLADPGTTVAVVGATDARFKYGSTIYRDLKRKGFKVYAVNPRRPTVDGDQAFPDLASLPEQPTIVNVVVPPNQTLRVLQQMVALGYDNVWIQPGAADEAVRDFAAANGMNSLIDACIMVEARPVATH